MHLTARAAIITTLRVKGEVESLDILGRARAKPVIERFVGFVHFHPGQVNGEPVPTRTSLHVQAALTPLRGDGRGVACDDVFAETPTSAHR